METREEAIRRMWQHILTLQTENRRLREALEALGVADAAVTIPQTAQMSVPPFELEQMIFENRSAATGAMAWPARRAATASAVAGRLVAVGAEAYTPMPQPPMPPMPQPPPGGVRTGNVDVGVVRQLTVEQLNDLPYGVVVVDREGTVLAYNDTESRLASVPKDRVLMRNFFREVAPCTQVKEFAGRFEAFTRGETRSSVEQFDFVFNFASGAQHVTIIFTPGRARGTYNILMTRR